MMIRWENIDLVVSRESIHESKDYASSAIFDNFFNEGSEVIVLRTSLI
jgi:hypothetical protein